MVLNDSLAQRRVRITASDISNKALRFAQRARLSRGTVPRVSAAWLAPVLRCRRTATASYQVTPALRAQAVFRRVNLVEAYSWPHLFPIIFCRNVMIYFDRQTQERVSGDSAGTSNRAVICLSGMRKA